MAHDTLADRRRGSRKTVSKSIALVVDSDRSTISHSAFAVDLSTLGARIRTSIDLRPGQLITVVPSEGRRQAVPSRVIWVGQPGSDKEGQAGIAFLSPISPDL